MKEIEEDDDEDSDDDDTESTNSSIFSSDNDDSEYEGRNRIETMNKNNNNAVVFNHGKNGNVWNGIDRVLLDDGVNNNFDIEDFNVTCEEYYHALLGSGLFLHVICPSLLIPRLYSVYNPPHFLPNSSRWWLGNHANSSTSTKHSKKDKKSQKSSGRIKYNINHQHRNQKKNKMKKQEMYQMYVKSVIMIYVTIVGMIGQKELILEQHLHAIFWHIV
eukprot:CAMPEP_0114382488 /NCGR_PEP_ID=MMETSP0102-20121206/4135_1 /TAXON_ID=38822 ORGANISM="Pteridomonas danica, Strain PT" /NCGR_SAMPLE_ID=MMETSP0102 /ASSEMBLY_ACC=CAM_ASM_000212 /LENGTH=216 /DNA_ID=CAMNT_0001538291 /DNA_START=1974 /DNA_END=2625 /DNA_ORIENTATION=+